MKRSRLLTTVMNTAAPLVNLIQNGDFGSATGWGGDIAGGLWEIGGGVVTCGADDVQLVQGNLITGMTNGQSYRMVYTVKTRTAGSVIARIGNTFLTARSAPGTYTESGVYDGAANSGFYSLAFRGTIDDVQLYANP